MPANYYELLGVARDATDKDIRQAYRRLAASITPTLTRATPEQKKSLSR